MKKLGLLLLGGIAAIIFLANLGPLVILGVSLLILYYVIKEFLKAESASSKIVWAVIGIIVLSISAHNIPAVIGIVAAYILFVVYKKWNKEKVSVHEERDPFTNFEREWAELKRTI
jgi:lia operon protein LiaI